jgi:hypothetical protein
MMFAELPDAHLIEQIRVTRDIWQFLTREETSTAGDSSMNGTDEALRTTVLTAASAVGFFWGW